MQNCPMCGAEVKLLQHDDHALGHVRVFECQRDPNDCGLVWRETMNPEGLTIEDITAEWDACPKCGKVHKDDLMGGEEAHLDDPPVACDNFVADVDGDCKNCGCSLKEHYNEPEPRNPLVDDVD